MLLRNCKWALAAIVAFAGMTLDMRTSSAFGHHRWGSSGGSWGSSGGSWGSSGGSWGSSGGSWGSSGGSSGGSWGHRHWRRHHSSGGSWGSSGGSSGGYVTYYGSSGGSWGSSGGSSGGSWGSSGGSSGGTVIYGPATPSTPAETDPMDPPSDTPPTPMPGAVYRSLGGGQVALLNVNVPADAKVFVNGAATTSTGTQRQYISRGLSAGNRYAYEVKVEMVRDGQTVTENKSVTLGPGEQANLAFNFDSKANPVAAEKAKTKLTLHVPADAKVFLAGRETSSTGEVREFTTSKLAPGAEWNDYTVKVVANINGQEVVREKTISLIGGQDRDLTIDLGTTEVAAK